MIKVPSALVIHKPKQNSQVQKLILNFDFGALLTSFLRGIRKIVDAPCMTCYGVDR